MFATAVCLEIEPQGSAPLKNVPWAYGFAEGDRKEVDTSRFVLIVDDDPDLLDVTSFVIENEGIPIVVLTAAEHAEVPGPMKVLSKPMDLKELLRVVERYVRGDKDASG
jgi:hypothetical protein